MTGLLISVRNVAEARAALAGGADIIDIKEPSRGSLGPADPAVWREIVAEIGPHAIVTAALGELGADPIEQLAEQAAGLTFVKIGLAGCAQSDTWQHRWWQATHNLPVDVQSVPVAYADWSSSQAPSPTEVLALAAELPAKLMLIDTHAKRGPTLLDFFPRSELERFARAAADCNVRLALAGSLKPADIESLQALEPAYLGFRGAACTGGRAGTIRQALVKSLADAVRAAARFAAV